MNDPLLMWGDRQASAQTDEDRRALMAELATWRAKNLTDIPQMRRATYTLARLLQLVGNHEQAKAEASTLVSLCRTPPEAADEEIASVQALTQSLGMASQPPPRVSGAPPERRDGRAKAREPRSRDKKTREREPATRSQEARAAAAIGDWKGVIRATEGVRAANAMLFRGYAELSLAMEGPAGELENRLAALRGLLARAAGIRSPVGAGVPGDDPLSKLLGEPVPHRRGARMRVIEAFQEAHPERIDELAEAVLLHHVQIAGTQTPAPWLVGVVGKALATTAGERASATIATLREQRAVAVAAYDEWPFERLQRVTRRAHEAGHTVTSLRRGVLAKEEPDDRKMWTLRITIDGTERMLVVGRHATQSYGRGKAEMLAERLKSLCSRTLLLATGSGNEALREHAAKIGLSVQAHDADDDALLAALASAPEASGSSSSSSSSPPPPDLLVQALQAEPFDPEAVRQAVADFRRPDRALRPVLQLDLDDARTAALIEAVHAVAPPNATMPEGTTLAVRAAANGPKTRAALIEGEAAQRFGGPGVGVVIDLAAGLVADGWHLHRVLRGPTRRESRQHPAIDTLSAHIAGLWRLLVRRGGQRGEVWHVADLPPEGRAAVPLLLLEDHDRVVVISEGSELVAWWATLQGAPEALVWTGAELAAVQEQAAAFPVSQPDRPPREPRGAEDPGAGAPQPAATEPAVPQTADPGVAAPSAVAPDAAAPDVIAAGPDAPETAAPGDGSAVIAEEDGAEDAKAPTDPASQPAADPG